MPTSASRSLLKKDPVAPVQAEPNLTDRVTEMLLEEITSGDYRVGEVLPPEQIIATRMGVSRTVLREAVSRLKGDGIVQSKQGRGLTVMQTARPSVLRMQAADIGDADQVLRIVELRRGFEIEAAQLAAQRRSEEDLAAMRQALRKMGDAIATGDVAVGVDADMEFHRCVARATRNEHYLNFFDFLAVLLKKNLRVSRSRSAKIAGRGAQAQKEHEALFAAIEKGDVELARQQARTHVDNTEARLRTAAATAEKP
ncbi:FadR family transcriptional regulator [Achromobacter denitrificans]|jgi:GntR family transcriptional repressor for pyruvate dehydrogenase complex|uniref:FadR family transcriptional regulator n=1 Tax=Achromobacter denitrificans TaxID=32002 RepID=A0A3R9GMU9_ACHDE|nr:FadR/GntR family transcriptional regulator [Achromobacter denitrificans]ASC68517.1 FadR family transcriptional regulator [Achromobacter denitrificans]MBV2159866.1 FadR family transcriptional regulator [Achromobacter denitrificans]OLU05759.1 GntR family transcriptional regulator [Achromobacter denitrificans]QCS66714.1 FadR family transcriptional regulator [Achromobacter denitrificans]QKH40409.1 FadR family transcriptional regulator [Achromobacter denitrificans]